MNADRLVQHAEGYNQASARRVPGGVWVSLDHRTVSDNAVEFFVPEDRIVFWYGDDRGSPLDADVEDPDAEFDALCKQVIGEPL